MAREKVDLYEEVTNTIIEQIEAGVMPWAQPWDSAACGPVLPTSAKSKKAYSGINVLLLWHATLRHGFTSNYWLTFKQAKDFGGMVRKGSKGTPIVYADNFVPKAERARAAAAGEDPDRVFFLKRFTVFNVCQIDGLPEHVAPAAPKLTEGQQVAEADRLIAATGADFRIGGSKAFYVPALDYVMVPPQSAYRAPLDWYRTAFHELSHWTGHECRLDRGLNTETGQEDYAREELVAEIGAAYLCASLGIQPTVRHADYIGGWLQVLRNDKRAIFRAASKASKAADFILAKGERDAAKVAEAA